VPFLLLRLAAVCVRRKGRYTKRGEVDPDKKKWKYL
jgi:hypothetical protein